MRQLLVTVLIIMIGVSGCDTLSGTRGEKNVLVFSKTSGYRHESIEAGQEALRILAEDKGFGVTFTEDATVMTQAVLQDFDAIIFLNTTGDCLDDQQQLEMQRFVQAGGGFVGVHAAADTEYDWPWYGGLVGAYFNGHPSDPNVRDAMIDRLDKEHVSCQHLPDRWARTDEWYNYKKIQPDLNVLLNLDESTYEGGTNGDNHPIAWYHDYDGGRAFYTGGGHTSESFEEPDFMAHLWGGIQYAIGGPGLDYSRPTVAPEENRFQKVVLEDNLNEPMELEMLPDGRILFIERRGDIKLYDPTDGKTAIISHLKTFNELEDGVLGLALDPNFAENNWLYIYYSPPGDEHKQHLSRFTFTDDKVDFGSEKVVMVVQNQRDQCCHSGGSLEFGPNGNLFLSTGDNTNPFASNGYSPSDERPGRSPWDAQKSSANTNDLRGKVCRITPQPDGSYTIPDGNLFPKDGSQGRPEIYAMGCRNPFRISLDQRTGYLYWGDVGPDAGKDSLGRGFRGHDEVNQARQAGFFGWPYFVADNKPYNKYDFATQTSLDPFDPAKPLNTSPNNTGIQELPPAQPAFIWYPYAESEEFPLVGTGGRNAMAGPVFYLDDYPENEARFPAYYDRKLFTYDWIRGWIMAITMNEQGDFVRMERFLPSYKFNNPIDIIMGPQGDMYLLEYGTAWNKRNKDARLVHLRYIKGNRAPNAKVMASATEGATPFEVTFDASETADPDGDKLRYNWQFGADEGSGSGAQVTHVFEEPGVYTVELEVVDRDGLKSQDQIKIYAGNAPPSIEVAMQRNQSFFFPGRTVSYSVNVDDEEDGSTRDQGIRPEQVAFSIDYLEQGTDINEISLGHEALAQASRFAVGKSLMDDSDCAACHFKDQESVGPTYREVAARYHSIDTARSYLVDKVLNGGGGVWGVNAMAAHPQITEEDAGKMVDWILAIASEDEAKMERLPAVGSYTFAEEQKQGTYIVMASYTDQGAEGAQPLTASKVLTLRSPRRLAADADELSEVSKHTPDADQLAQMGISEQIDILLGAAEGSAAYHQIDLTGIAAIEGTIVLAPDFTSGGQVVITKDSPDGEVLGTMDVPQQPANFGLRAYSAPLVKTEGKHDLYFSMKGAESMLGIILYWDFIPDEGT